MRTKTHFSSVLHGLLLPAVIGMLVQSGCGSSTGTNTNITTLRIGVLPGENRKALQRQFSPLVAYLQQELDLPCRLLLHESYEELQLAFEDGEVDLAWFGGYTFVNVQRSRGAVALVSRDRDLRFTSYFLVRAGETGTELSDFRGKRCAFGSRLSTSGHLMPRYYLEEWEIDPETFFDEVTYTGAHDKTVLAVRDGETDVGVASSTVVDTMIAEGTIGEDQVRILKETPSYLDYVWACQAEVPPDLRSEIRDAFLKLTPEDPTHARILKHLRAEFFVPVNSESFRELRSIAESADLAMTTTP